MTKTKRMALTSALAAIALTIFVAEAQIPPIVPIPGVKLGLSNIMTLVTMALLGRREAGAVLLIRIVLGSMFTGSVSAMLYSLAGGALAYLVMCALIGLFPDTLLWVVSILSAIAHNAGQLITVILVVQTPSLVVYAPALLAAGILTGAFTGFAAMYLVKSMRKLTDKT